MSHFSTIRTKIKNKPELVEALELLQYNVVQDVKLENPLDHEHKEWQVDVAIGNDIGAKNLFISHFFTIKYLYNAINYNFRR